LRLRDHWTLALLVSVLLCCTVNCMAICTLEIRRQNDRMRLDAIADELAKVHDQTDRILHGKGPEPLSMKPAK
jgi:hypothetical protein